MTNYILAVAQATAIQMVGILGIFFVFGFILAKLQTWTQTNYRQVIGWNGILFTAWIGTPIHELGHAFFAIIFRHKIQHISLFEPNERTGGLGHVEHSYNTKSLYQRVGNFFIGAAPMIFGGLFLFFLIFLIQPFASFEMNNWIYLPANLLDVAEFTNIGYTVSSFLHDLSKIVVAENLKLWYFWIFAYISFCVVAHISPSKQDLKNMWRGFGWMIFILFFVNVITVACGVDLTTYILGLNQYMGIAFCIFLYATIVAVLHWLLSLIILRPFRRH